MSLRLFLALCLPIAVWVAGVVLLAQGRFGPGVTVTVAGALLIALVLGVSDRLRRRRGGESDGPWGDGVPSEGFLDRLLP